MQNNLKQFLKISDFRLACCCPIHVWSTCCSQTTGLMGFRRLFYFILFVIVLVLKLCGNVKDLFLTERKCTSFLFIYLKYPVEEGKSFQHLTLMNAEHFKHTTRTQLAQCPSYFGQQF